MTQFPTQQEREGRVARRVHSGKTTRLAIPIPLLRRLITPETEPLILAEYGEAVTDAILGRLECP